MAPMGKNSPASLRSVLRDPGPSPSGEGVERVLCRGRLLLRVCHTPGSKTGFKGWVALILAPPGARIGDTRLRLVRQTAASQHLPHLRRAPVLAAHGASMRDGGLWLPRTRPAKIGEEERVRLARPRSPGPSVAFGDISQSGTLRDTRPQMEEHHLGRESGVGQVGSSSCTSKGESDDL